jgi:hypothetical protein
VRRVVGRRYRADAGARRIPPEDRRRAIVHAFDELSGLRPRRLRELAAAAVDVLVYVPPYVGLALTGTTSKPLALTSTVEVVNPMARSRNRAPLEVIRTEDAAAPLPSVFEARAVTQLVVFVVEDGAAVDERQSRAFADALGAIGASLGRIDAAAALVLVGETCQLVRPLPADPRSIDAFRPRRENGRPAWVDCLEQVFGYFPDDNGMFPNALRRVIVVADGRASPSRQRVEEILPIVERMAVFVDALLLSENHDIVNVAMAHRGCVSRIDAVQRFVGEQIWLDPRLRM